MVRFRRAPADLWGEFPIELLNDKGWRIEFNGQAGREIVEHIHFYQRKQNQGLCKAAGRTPDGRWITLSEYNCNE